MLRVYKLCEQIILVVMCSSNCKVATSVVYTIRHERPTIPTAHIVRQALFVQDGAQATCGVEGGGLSGNATFLLRTVAECI